MGKFRILIKRSARYIWFSIVALFFIAHLGDQFIHWEITQTQKRLLLRISKRCQFHYFSVLVIFKKINPPTIASFLETMSDSCRFSRLSQEKIAQRMPLTLQPWYRSDTLRSPIPTAAKSAFPSSSHRMKRSNGQEVLRLRIAQSAVLIMINVTPRILLLVKVVWQFITWLALRFQSFPLGRDVWNTEIWIDTNNVTF